MRGDRTREISSLKTVLFAVKNDSDNLTALHALVPLLSHNCRSERPKDMINVDEKSILELKLACLRGLREHVGLMHRLSANPKHLDIVMVSHYAQWAWSVCADVHLASISNSA